MSFDIQSFAMRYGQAWEQHDPDAIIAMHTQDTVFDQHGLHEAVGRDAVREAIAGLFAQSPDLTFAHRRGHFGADHFVTEYVVSGTIEGHSVACEGVDVFTLRDGLVARKDTYLDLAGMQRQLEADLNEISA